MTKSEALKAKRQAIHAKRWAAMLAMVREREDGATREQAAQAMRCTTKQTVYELALMVKAGLLVMVGKNVRTRYCEPERKDAVADAVDDLLTGSVVEVRQSIVPAADVKSGKPARAVRSVFELAGVLG